jgi:nucleoside-diphosphate-sugar epimerase
MGKKYSNILVLGAGGNFNQALVPQLIDGSYRVRAFDLRELDYGCECVVGSVRDYASVFEACKDMDVIVHAAGLHDTLPRSTAHPEAYDDFWLTNVHGTHVVYRAALEQGVKKVIFLSSIAYYKCGPGFIDEDWPASRPAHNYYDLSKVLSEDIARLCSSGHQVKSIVLRPGNFTGLPEPSFSFLGGRLRREDMAQAALLSIEYDPAESHFEVFNVLAGNPFSPEDLPGLAKQPLDVLEKYIPRVKDFLQEKGLEMKPMTTVMSCRRAQEKLGYKPQYTFETYLQSLGFKQP